MSKIDVGHLIKHLAQWVRQTPDRPCMDVGAFKRLAGVRFALLEDASLQFMFGVLPSGLIPLEQVSVWLRFEAMDPAADVGEAERAAMRALVADAAAYATTIAPPLDGLASHHARRAAAGPSGLLLTEQAIRTLHARLLAGDSHAQAAAVAGLPQTLARSAQRAACSAGDRWCSADNSGPCGAKRSMRSPCRRAVGGGAEVERPCRATFRPSDARRKPSNPAQNGASGVFRAVRAINFAFIKPL